MSTSSKPRRSPIRFTFLGVLGGFLGALGLLVVLQQAGSVYPTPIVTIAMAVGGIATGVLLPSLAGLTGRKNPTT